MRRLLAVFFLSGLGCHGQLSNEAPDVDGQEGGQKVARNFMELKAKPRILTHREYSELIQTYVSQPRPEAGTFGIGFVYQGNGDWRLCDRAPEPSALSLLLVGGMVLAVGRRNENSWQASKAGRNDSPVVGRG